MLLSLTDKKHKPLGFFAQIMKTQYPGIGQQITVAYNKDKRFANPHIRYAELVGTGLCKLNLAFIDHITQKLGKWPSIELVGWNGAHAACMIVVASDHDLEAQKRYLYMIAALPRGHVDPVDLACLEDRVCINGGMEQIYGTQMEQVGDSFMPRPIRSVNTIDSRRHNVGLDTLDAQIRRVIEGKTFFPAKFPKGKKSLAIRVMQDEEKRKRAVPRGFRRGGTLVRGKMIQVG